MSTPLQKKAQENLDSARFLIGNECYDSSIHCSYYACLQAVKQILFDEMGEARVAALLSANNKSTHLCLTREIARRYSAATGERDDYRNLLDRLNYAKRLRTDADYEKRHFTQFESNLALKEATDLIDQLQSTF